MSRISEASVCAAVALKVGVLGGVCSDVFVLVCLLNFVFSVPKTLPIAHSISPVFSDAR